MSVPIEDLCSTRYISTSDGMSLECPLCKNTCISWFDMEVVTIDTLSFKVKCENCHSIAPPPPPPCICGFVPPMNPNSMYHVCNLDQSSGKVKMYWTHIGCAPNIPHDVALNYITNWIDTTTTGSAWLTDVYNYITNGTTGS